MFSNISEKLVLENRSGSVLSKGTILKIDLLPKGHESEKLKKEKSLIVPFSGTKNFRKVENLNIFGTSQPPIYALNAMFNILSNDKTSSTTFINLREEPGKNIQLYCFKNKLSKSFI